MPQQVLVVTRPLNNALYPNAVTYDAWLVPAGIDGEEFRTALEDMTFKRDTDGHILADEMVAFCNVFCRAHMFRDERNRICPSHVVHDPDSGYYNAVWHKKGRSIGASKTPDFRPLPFEGDPVIRYTTALYPAV